MSTDRTAPVSDHVARAIAALRERRGLTRAALAAAAQTHGAEQLTTPALRNLEDRRRVGVTVDELLAVAAALACAPAQLLGPHAELFGEPTEQAVVAPETCRSCSHKPGPIEAAVLDDIQALGDLVGVEQSLAATARRLARELDGTVDHARGCGCDCGAPAKADGRVVATLARALSGVLGQLTAGQRGGDDDGDDGLGDLDAPE